MITQTKPINQALSIVISLYVIFELQFGTHNRIIHLLYEILLQEPSILSKQLRLTLKQWDFHIDKKEHTRNDTQNPTTINTHSTSYKNMEKCTSQTSPLSNSSSPIYPPLIVDIAIPEKQKEPFLSESIMIKNDECMLNVIESNSSKSSHLSTTNKKKSSSKLRKRQASPEKPIAQRLKRSRN
ncbi:unnamed protein product [Rotaria sordida]|uniref:Uncharacterized protein n=1 Tax=Rotaria sordida TaxID=392033 RepID=A0A818RW35_9BILA|nr:unnamed protein product [Rotaria sordida]